MVDENESLKVDFGCGPNKRDGFKGADVIKFDNVDFVFDIGKDIWPFASDSIDEAHASHFVEHLKPHERIHFVNELQRTLKKGAGCSVIVPHWASQRAYGDLTHEWPPVSEFWFYYLSKDWRKTNAPHTDIEFNPTGYNCDLECTWGYAIHQQIAAKNAEAQSFCLTFYKEAAQDLHATIRKK